MYAGLSDALWRPRTLRNNRLSRKVYRRALVLGVAGLRWDYAGKNITSGDCSSFVYDGFLLSQKNCDFLIWKEF